MRVRGENSFRHFSLLSLPAVTAILCVNRLSAAPASISVTFCKETLSSVVSIPCYKVRKLSASSSHRQALVSPSPPRMGNGRLKVGR